ncbi:transglycosylase family protein [Nakamurella panacisegetis]|uniref:transglycosylase family protein n=1 Tax=Nakamurella panacisegetis TaxID=1090615 RepID=UPI0022B266CA|nr:transglycosylase family protein [Nakamurella panacisegetis]
MIAGAISVLVATGVVVATIGSASAEPSAGDWLKLRNCESGGNYSTNTGNGYYGAYQFDLGTWQSIGGSGLPSNASAATQDALAYKLWQQRGWSPWTCASIVGLPAGGSGGPARVATVRAAPKVLPAQQRAHLDSVRYDAASGRLIVTGWALDANHPRATSRVKVTINNWTTTWKAATRRADVNRSTHVAGAHGYSVAIASSSGRKRVCVTLVAMGSSPARVLGCKVVNVPVKIRERTSMKSIGGRAVVAGWTFDNAAPARSVAVSVTVNGVKHRVAANLPSSGPSSVFGVPGKHGFRAGFALRKGGNRVCVTVMGVTASHNHAVACKILTG